MAESGTRNQERLSARAHDHEKVLRMARTITDIEGAESIVPHHLAEAIRTRGILHRTVWERMAA